MNKPYKELNCPEYDEINADIVDFLLNHTKILQNDPRNDPSLRIPYPNFVDASQFIRKNPKLYNYFHEIGVKLLDVYFAVAFQPNYPDAKNNWFPGMINPTHVNSCPIHIDRPPVQWKMNWPVMNMMDTGVSFYKLKNSNESIDQHVMRTGVVGTKDQDVYSLPYEPFELWHRHMFNKTPILMNGLLPHDVWFNKNVPMPRIGLQIMFFKEPRHLLDPDCVILPEN